VHAQHALVFGHQPWLLSLPAARVLAWHTVQEAYGMHGIN
jgi:hypothetical protein